MRPDVDQPHVEALGRDARGELGRLADDHVRTPSLHQFEHPRQCGAGVEADEELTDHPFRAQAGVREDRRPGRVAISGLPEGGEVEPGAVDHARAAAGAATRTS